MADIQYLNYGDLQIELLALLNNLANLVQGYVQKQPWSNKRKEMFMSAYSELMNRGILGASNTNGQWMLNVGGDTPLDLDSKSKKEKEMYLEAAYFIQQQMAGLPTKTSQEEEKKEDLPVFDNKYFTSELIKHISNKDYGGLDILMGDGEKENDWNRLDARDEKGIRGRKNRAKVLAGYLKEYSDSLDESKLSFEGSPFTNLNDFKGRINKAIEALGTKNTEDDIPALNAIGLRASDWFNNGSGDPFKTEGYEGTYGDYYGRFLPQLEKDKVKVEAEKLKAIRANQFDKYRFFNFLNGTPGSLEDFNLIGLKLSGQQTLDGNDISRISWAFRQGMKNGGLTNLSKEELSKFGSRYISTPNRLKKLPGLEGIYYDSYVNRLIQPFKGLQLIGASLAGILELNNPELLELKRLELQNSKKLKDEDWDIITADTVSMLGDLVSLGGGYAGAAGGITTILSDLYSDLKRGKDFWDVTKNLAKNTAWGFAGLIPGVKLAKFGKRAALLYALYNSWGIITDPDVHKSWKKLINGEDFTSHDFENLKWTLHAVTGAHNTVRSHYTDKNLQNKTLKTVVETKNGQKSITLSQIKEINKVGGRGGLLKALNKFKEITGEEAKPNQFLFNTEGRSWYNPTRYSQKLRNLTSDENILKGQTQFNRFTTGRLLVLDKNKPLIANPFKTSTYKGWFTLGGPNKGYYTIALSKSYNNSIPKQNQLQQNNSLLSQQNLSLNQKKTREIFDNFEATGKAPTSPKHNLTRNEWRKKNKKLYNSIDKKGRFTNNMPEEGTYEFKDPTGNTHTFKLIQRDDDFLLDIKSSNGSSRQAVLTLDLVKKGVWENIKLSLNTGLRNDISLPANIIRTLQGTAYSWLKQGGTIDKQKIQKYKEFINK